MDEGLAWAGYRDNNRQVQPHLHVSKVTNWDFRLGVFRLLSLSWPVSFLILLWLFFATAFAPYAPITASS